MCKKSHSKHEQTRYWTSLSISIRPWLGYSFAKFFFCLPKVRSHAKVSLTIRFENIQYFQLIEIIATYQHFKTLFFLFFSVISTNENCVDCLAASCLGFRGCKELLEPQEDLRIGVWLHFFWSRFDVLMQISVFTNHFPCRFSPSTGDFGLN